MLFFHTLWLISKTEKWHFINGQCHFITVLLRNKPYMYVQSDMKLMLPLKGLFSTVWEQGCGVALLSRTVTLNWVILKTYMCICSKARAHQLNLESY